MLKQIKIKNFTVFPEADLTFSPELNIVIGENSAGKTHLLKLLYSVISANSNHTQSISRPAPTKSLLQSTISEKLVGVFKPESLGRLVTRKRGRERCEISLLFSHSSWNISFNFATQSKSEVYVDHLPSEWVSSSPIYLPTKELLSIYPNFISIYDGHYLEFDETWRDTCRLLGAPLQRGPRETAISTLLEPIETAVGGKLVLENGRFYLRSDDGKMEMGLVAEGYRKLGMLARLIATGALLDNGYLFWDEPDANLNPKLIRVIANCIVNLSKAGLQVFIATHSLFLIREIELQSSTSDLNALTTKYFSFYRTADQYEISQGAELTDLIPIVSLDEELAQSDRILSTTY